MLPEVMSRLASFISVAGSVALPVNVVNNAWHALAIGSGLTVACVRGAVGVAVGLLSPNGSAMKLATLNTPQPEVSS
jgi:hypothetical protein